MDTFRTKHQHSFITLDQNNFHFSEVPLRPVFYHNNGRKLEKAFFYDFVAQSKFVAEFFTLQKVGNVSNVGFRNRNVTFAFKVFGRTCFF